ncbi:Mitochondrial ATPase complex subunit atp10 [Mortierella sp. AD031]|nr:Mitochondrial ATPase complex subunit atp10 [Mortierella sp. AD031]
MTTLSQVELLDMAREVLVVCSHCSLQDIITDLTISKSAEVTINRIFDGQFLKEIDSESDLPPLPEPIRAKSPERLVSPRSQSTPVRSQPTSTRAPAPNPTPSSKNVVVILSSDEEDNVKTEETSDVNDSSDTEDDFIRLMKNIQRIKTAKAAGAGTGATSKRTNGSPSGASAAKSIPSALISPRRRTALSPPLILSHRSIASVSGTLATFFQHHMEECNSISDNNATECHKTRICYDDPDQTELYKSKRVGSRGIRRQDTIFLRGLPGLGHTSAPRNTIATTKADTETLQEPYPQSEIFFPYTAFLPFKEGMGTFSVTFARIHGSTLQQRQSDDLLPGTRDFGTASPVDRYSNVEWLRKVKSEKQPDRAVVIMSDGEDGEGEGKGKDEDRNWDYGAKEEFKCSTSSKTVSAAGFTDVFDDPGSKKWSEYESLVDNDLSPPRTYLDDDPVDPLDANDDLWTGIRKRTHNTAGLSLSPSAKDLKKAKPGTKASSSSLVVAGIDHFDLSGLDEYRDDPTMLDDDLTGDLAIEREIERRSRQRQQRKGRATTKIESLDLDNLDDGSVMAEDYESGAGGKKGKRATKPRRMKAEASEDSDLDFDANDSDAGDGSDTGVPKKLTAKEKVKKAAQEKREAALAAKELAKAAREAAKAEKEAAKAVRDMEKELERSEREAKAAERKAQSQNKDKEAKKKQKEREEERVAKAEELEAAKKAEREMRNANRLTRKSESVKEIVLCMEESMFDSEMGKALQDYLRLIECHIDLLKSPISAATAAAAAAAASARAELEEETTSTGPTRTSLSELNGTNDACPVRDLIFWRRIVRARYDQDQEVIVPLPEEEHTVELESFWLCYMTAENFSKMVKEDELHTFVKSVKRDMRLRMSRQRLKQEAMMGSSSVPVNEDRTRRQRVIFLIMGMADYLRGMKLMTTRSFQQAVLAQMREAQAGGGGGGGGARGARVGGVAAVDTLAIDSDEIDREMMKLQLEQDCLIIHTEDHEESAQAIVSLTEQLGQRPYKAARKSGLNVCVDGIKCGQDYTDSWIKALQQVHMVTFNIAKSIAAEYPTIRSLYEGYRRCASVYDAMAMLEGIEVIGRRTYIGKTISKRVYDVFMGENPEQSVSNRNRMSFVTGTATRTLLRTSSTAAQIHNGACTASASASIRRTTVATAATAARRSTAPAPAVVSGSRYAFTTSTRQYQEQSSSRKGDEDDEPAGSVATRELPLSPYGGRFGVPEQPMSTKSIAQAQANNGKRSPFSKAKEGMKSKVHDWTDEKKNLEKRKELLHDFQSGYFAEFSELSKTGSKLWKATPSMINAEKALYMPNIIGTSLKTSEPVELVDLLRGKISLVAVSGTRFGEEHIESYMTPFLKRWPMTGAGSNSSKVQLVELNIQENPLKAGLVRMMVPFVKKTIPEERHANYVLHYKSIKHLKDPLSMQNSYLGYVFLVDSNCKIRWGAHGPATEAEVKTLLESVQKLSERGGR